MGTRRSFLGKLLALPLVGKTLGYVDTPDEVEWDTRYEVEVPSSLVGKSIQHQFMCSSTQSFSIDLWNPEMAIRYVDLTEPEKGDNDELRQSNKD